MNLCCFFFSLSLSFCFVLDSVFLDTKHGRERFDNEIFMKFARYYEDEFMHDMEDLGVRPPTVLTRISEYGKKFLAYFAR